MKTAVRTGLLGAGLIVVAAAGYFVFERSREVPSAPAPTASSAAPAGMLVDPISPERPAALDSGRAVNAANWVTARPGFQYSLPAAQRGGVAPCASRPVDTSAFHDWQRLGQGRFIAPRSEAVDASGHFDLVIHLNGDEPIRRELATSKQRFVLYTLTIEPGRSYASLFSGTPLYRSIIDGIERALGEREQREARVRHVALSAWSAGFVGVAALLGQEASKNVDAVVLVDGLHAPRKDQRAFEAQLKPFVDYAARAARGERFFFVSHSSIDPPGFASTTECAHYLIASLGGAPQAVRRKDSLGLELVEYFTRGELHVRGYAGNDKADHCAQLAVLAEVYAALGRRWSRRAEPGPAGTP
jgi:hypothetical protein